MAVSLLPKIFFAFTVLKCDWGWEKVIRTVVFCLLNYLFSIYSVSTSNTLRPCPNSGTWIPVLSLTSCWTGTGLHDKGSTKPCCLGLGSRPGVHRACLEPSLQRRLRLLLTCRCTFPAPAWHLSWGCRWLLPALSAAHPACAAAPCLITEGTACTWDTLGSQLSPLHTAAAWQLPSWATTYQS